MHCFYKKRFCDIFNVLQFIINFYLSYPQTPEDFAMNALVGIVKFSAVST